MGALELRPMRLVAAIMLVTAACAALLASMLVASQVERACGWPAVGAAAMAVMWFASAAVTILVSRWLWGGDT